MRLPLLDCVLMALATAFLAVLFLAWSLPVLAACFAIAFCVACVEYRLARAFNSLQADQHRYMHMAPDTDWDAFNESLLFHGRDYRPRAA